MQFINKNPEFLELNRSEQEELIEIIVLKKYQTSLGKQTPCTNQLESDLDYCHQTQYIGAAMCGLTAPSLAGAIVCGAGVVAYAEVCHNQSYSDWELCMEATY